MHLMDTHNPYLPSADFSNGLLSNFIKRFRVRKLFKGYGTKSYPKISDESKSLIRELYSLSVKYMDHCVRSFVSRLDNEWKVISTTDQWG